MPRSPKPRRYPLQEPEIGALTLVLLASQMPYREIVTQLADIFGVTVKHQALTGFRRRHAAHIDGLEGQLAQGVVESAMPVAIADKTHRMREYQSIYDGYRTVLDTRGPEARDTKFVQVYRRLQPGEERPTDSEGRPLDGIAIDGSDDELFPIGREMVEVVKVDKGLADVLTGILEKAAEEMGELPQRGVNLNMQDNRSINVLNLEGMSEDERRALYALALRRRDGS